MISIIIPVYNAEKTISKCLESVLANKDVDFEIIAINDGSKDSSINILHEFRKKYPEKLRVYDQENQGVAITRNKGIEYAKGEFVMFIDNDDYIESDYLKKFLNEIEKGGKDAIFGGYKRTTAAKVLYEMNLENTEWSKYMIMAPWAKIYRKDFLVKNNIKFLDCNIGEDVYFNLQVVNISEKVGIFDYCGYNWYFNKDSVSNTNQKSIKSGLEVMRLLGACYLRLTELDAIGKSEVEFYFIRYVVWYLLFVGRNSEYMTMYEEYKKLFSWLREKFPNFQKNRNIGLFFPKGETLKNRIIVFIFMKMNQVGLMKAFFRIYSRTI